MSFTPPKPTSRYSRTNESAFRTAVDRAIDEIEARLAALEGLPAVSEPPPANVLPTANFTTSVVNLTVSFTDASSDPDGVITSRLWEFGDGTSSTATNPTHTYAAAGDYNVRLTVTDDDAGQDISTAVITVTAVPTASICLSRSDGTLRTVADNVTSPYTGGGTINSNTRWDARGSYFHTNDNQQIELTGAGSFADTCCWTGGYAEGSLDPLTFPWENDINNPSVPGYPNAKGYHNEGLFRFFKLRNFSVEEFLGYNSGDGFTFGDESPDNRASDAGNTWNFTTRNCAMIDCHDDVINNRNATKHTMIGNLFAGYNMYSVRPRSGGVNNAGSQIITFDDNILYLKAQGNDSIDRMVADGLKVEGGLEVRDTTALSPGVARFFKWHTSGMGTGPKVRLLGNTFFVQTNDNVGPSSIWGNLPFSSVLESENNVLLWTGSGSLPRSWPAEGSAIMQGFTVVRGAEALQEAQNRIAQWWTDHPNVRDNNGNIKTVI